MKNLEKPIEFKASLIEETKTHFVFSLPQDVQDLIKKLDAKYIFIEILDVGGSPT